MASTYEIGNALFVDFRAFIHSARLDPSKVKLVMEFDDRDSRGALTDALRASAPSIGENSRASGAQAGTHGGTWQGVPYEFTLRGERPNG